MKNFFVKSQKYRIVSKELLERFNIPPGNFSIASKNWKKTLSFRSSVSQDSQENVRIIDYVSEFFTHLQGNLGESRNFVGLRLRIPAGIKGPRRSRHRQRTGTILDPWRSEGGPLRWLTTGTRHLRSTIPFLLGKKINPAFVSIFKDALAFDTLR